MVEWHFQMSFDNDNFAPDLEALSLSRGVVVEVDLEVEVEAEDLM